MGASLSHRRSRPCCRRPRLQPPVLQHRGHHRQRQWQLCRLRGCHSEQHSQALARAILHRPLLRRRNPQANLSVSWLPRRGRHPRCPLSSAAPAVSPSSSRDSKYPSSSSLSSPRPGLRTRVGWFLALPLVMGPPVECWSGGNASYSRFCWYLNNNPSNVLNLGANSCITAACFLQMWSTRSFRFSSLISSSNSRVALTRRFPPRAGGRRHRTKLRITGARSPFFVTYRWYASSLLTMMARRSRTGANCK